MAVPRRRGDLDWRGPTTQEGVALVGLVLVGAGGVLPWVVKDLPVQVYVLGEASGLERIWVRRLLVLAGVGVVVWVAGLATEHWGTVRYLVLVGIGLLAVAVTVLTSPLTGRWEPGTGVYVTLLGGLLVVVGAGVSLVTMRATDGAGIPRSPGD